MKPFLAPNGKPSNLTPEQWHLVRTPEFKAWFGDWENDPENASKVVDENGEPLVCNHSSTEENIDIFYGNRIFRTKKNEVKPIWFNYKIGFVYATGEDIYHYECFLNIRKIFDYSNQEDVFNLKKYYEKINQKELPDYDYDYDWEGQEQLNLPAYIYEMGYDGYKFTDEYSIVVFESNQIKLADGSNTTFDGDNPDIRFSDGGLIAPNGKLSNLTPEQYELVRTKSFKDWFGDWENDPENSSKVVDENGEPMPMYHGTQYGYFTEFEKSKIGTNYKEQPFGFYFTNIKSANQLKGYSAEEYAHKKGIGKNPHVFEVFLNIKNPIVQDVFSERPADAIDWEHNDLRNQIRKSIVDSIKRGSKKIDGVIAESKRTNEIIAVALKSNQIKLADGTNTTFDGNNPDIRFAEGGFVIKDLIQTMKNGGYIDPYTGKLISKIYVSVKIPYNVQYSPTRLESIGDEFFNELSHGKLLGIRGVSGSPYNIADWFTHRDALIVINLKDFIEINNTEQILYENAEYLMKDGLDVFYRLFDRKEKSESNYKDVLSNLFPHISKESNLENETILDTQIFYAFASITDVFNSSKFLRWVVKQKRISSAQDLTNLFHEYFKSGIINSDYSPFYVSNLKQQDFIKYNYQLNKVIERGVLSNAKAYKDESEWIIKDMILRIPNGSQVFIKSLHYPNSENLINDSIKKHNLNSKYDIFFVNQKDIDRYQGIVFREKEKIYNQRNNELKIVFNNKFLDIINDTVNEIISDYKLEVLNLNKTNFGELKNPFDSDEIKSIYDSYFSVFLNILNEKKEEVLSFRSKYKFYEAINEFRQKLDADQGEISNNERLDFIDSFGRAIYLNDLIDILKSACYSFNYEKIIDGIKNKIGSDIYRFYDKKDVFFGKGGRLVAEKKAFDKFKKAEITDKYDVEALNEINTQNAEFKKQNLKETIKKAYKELIQSFNKYLISQDSEAITNTILNEIDVRYRQGDTDENISAYKNRINEKELRNEYIEKFKETQLNTIGEWIEYFNKSNYPYSFRFLTIKAILNFNYNFKTDELIKRTSKTIRNFTPFDAGTLAQVYEKRSDFILKDFTLIQIENAESIARAKELVATSQGGKWLKFKGGKNASKNEIEQNSKELSQLVQDTYWCTKTQAIDQLKKGDFYVYVTEKEKIQFPRIAIRMEGENVGEVRGNKSSAQDLEPEMLPIAEKFLLENIPNNSGKKWLDSIRYNEKALKLNKILTDNGLYKGCLEDYFELKKEEKKYLLDYSSENGHLKRIRDNFKLLLKENNEFYEKNEVVFNIEEFDPNKTKIIFEDADFRKSKIIDLGNLQSIGGSAYFNNSQITDLGNLQSIGGSADFEYSQITDLGNLQSIGGNTDFMNSQITDLGNLESIGGNAYFGNTQITDLGNLQSIGGSAYFGNTQITDLGNLKSIGFDADFRNSQITDLGNLQSIGGSANFEYSQITDLGNLKSIGGNANFRNSKITDLGNLQSIGFSAYFKNSQITDLGNLQSIGETITDNPNIEKILYNNFVFDGNSYRRLNK